MTRYSIYVGLNDPVTRKQKFGTEKYIEILKNVCKGYHVEFSFAVIEGGYIYEDGNYTEEKTLYISLFNQPEETVNDIARDLCTFFGQECVMVSCGEVTVKFIKGDEEVIEATRK